MDWLSFAIGFVVGGVAVPVGLVFWLNRMFPKDVFKIHW